MNTSIKEWYAKANPNDKYVNELELINSKVTFADVYNALRNKEDIYKTIGCESTVLRQYIFNELANKLNCAYDDIYNAYLRKDDNKTIEQEPLNSYLVSIPVSGILSIQIDSMSFEETIDLILEVIDGADYGALKNISDNINRDSEQITRECIEDLLMLGNYEEGVPFNFKNYVEGSLVVSIKATSATNALEYAQRNLSEIKEQIRNDHSLIGDLENPMINEDKIGLYEFRKDSVKEVKREAIGKEK